MRKVFTIIVLLAMVVTVSAQSKWTYKLGFGGEFKSGNVNTTIFSNNGGVERNDSILAFDANYKFVYGKKDGVEFEKNFTGNVKFDLWQYSRWSPFVSATYDYNPFKLYYYKLSFLVGAKYRIFWNANCDYSLSAAYVFDYTDYYTPTDPDATILRPDVSRLSLRFKMKQKITDAVSLKHTTFYQPSFYDFTGDYIVNSVTSLSTQLSKHSSLAVNFTYDYHSLVPAGVQKQDIITTVSLNMTF